MNTHASKILKINYKCKYNKYYIMMYYAYVHTLYLVNYFCTSIPSQLSRILYKNEKTRQMHTLKIASDSHQLPWAGFKPSTSIIDTCIIIADELKGNIQTGSIDIH